MEVFTIKMNNTSRVGLNEIYIQYVPENNELLDRISHGVTLPIVGSIAETVASYEATAAREMSPILERMYPDCYSLDMKYA